MPKFSALIAVVLASLSLPALAAAAPTASQITTPANPSFVTVDNEQPGTLHVAGTVSGGDGPVDLRCYYGTASGKLAGGITVANGEFQANVPLDTAALIAVGYPRPFCTLRAVPANTVPAAPPGSPSAWSGPAIGWGQEWIFRLGNGNDPNPPETPYDYLFGRAQARAFSDYNSVASCGLCDTYVFTPASKAGSNAIWYGNAGLFAVPRDVAGRTAVEIDGVSAYTAGSVVWNPLNLDFDNHVGFPAMTATRSVDPVSGDLTIDEHTEFKKCAPSPAVFEPTQLSCASFADTGVVLDRSIHQGDDGLQITITDRWKSVDGQPHDLDAMYEDTEHSENAMTLGHEGRADFTWTEGGFRSFKTNTSIPVPPTVPATILVKTDATTPDAGDDKNPFGAVTLGTQPSEISVADLGGIVVKNGRWHTRYERTIPAGGSVVISMVYSHDLTLDSVKAKAHAAEAALSPVADPRDQAPGGAATPQSAPAADPVGASPPASDPTGVPAVIRCVVPKLRGVPLAKAKRMLAQAHCRVGKVARRASTRAKPGRVVATRFKAGTRLRAGTPVPVTIAKKA